MSAKRTHAQSAWSSAIHSRCSTIDLAPALRAASRLCFHFSSVSGTFADILINFILVAAFCSIPLSAKATFSSGCCSVRGGLICHNDQARYAHSKILRVRSSNRATLNLSSYEHNADLRPSSLATITGPRSQPAGSPDPGSGIRDPGGWGWGMGVGLGGYERPI